MGEERKEITAEELFDNAEKELRTAIIMDVCMEIDATPGKKRNIFNYVEKQLKDPCENPAGAACKQYIKYAAEFGKIDIAEAEICRLLDAQRYGNISLNAAKKAAKEIVEMYMPALEHDDTSVNQDAGAVLTEIQHMKSLLDIMEKNIQGKLTEQEVAEMEKNGESWIIDIEKLRQMVVALEN